MVSVRRDPIHYPPLALAAEFGQGRAYLLKRMHMKKCNVQPRVLRAYQAPSYLGMCRAEFNKTVRPYVREFPIGQQGIGFDRIELDQWADAYIEARSIEKIRKAEPSPLPFDAPQAKRKERGPIMNGMATSTPTYKPTTSADFYRLIDEILGRSTDTKDRRRKKQENQNSRTKE